MRTTHVHAISITVADWFLDNFSHIPSVRPEDLPVSCTPPDPSGARVSINSRGVAPGLKEYSALWALSHIAPNEVLDVAGTQIGKFICNVSSILKCTFSGVSELNNLIAI